MECVIDGVSSCLFGGGFEALLLGFDMCLYFMNCHGSRLRALGEGVSGVLDSCDTGIKTLNVFEMPLLEQGDLLLEICGILDEALIDFFEEVDIRFGLDGVLAFFCTVCGK